MTSMTSASVTPPAADVRRAERQAGDRGLAVLLFTLGALVAATSVLGPLVLDVLHYRTSASGLDQIRGTDLTALALVAPLCVWVGGRPGVATPPHRYSPWRRPCSPSTSGSSSCSAASSTGCRATWSGSLPCCSGSWASGSRWPSGPPALLAVPASAPVEPSAGTGHRRPAARRGRLRGRRHPPDLAGRRTAGPTGRRRGAHHPHAFWVIKVMDLGSSHPPHCSWESGSCAAARGRGPRPPRCWAGTPAGLVGGRDGLEHGAAAAQSTLPGPGCRSDGPRGSADRLRRGHLPAALPADFNDDAPPPAPRSSGRP